MYQSLAVKYRPQTLDEVVGQEVVVTILKQAIAQQSFQNAYLFAGDSGCGKTTLARIFAKAINKGLGEPIEIDAASNNGVDNVRAIIENAKQRSLVCEYKIFIIDECHSITSQGWQAFLKGIEEPPAYAIFMFCTTEPTKIPATILNRVQRYNITKIGPAKIEARLKQICAAEGFTNYEQTCSVLSKLTQGSMRDAITYLDQCSSYSKDLSFENAKKVLPQLSYESMFRLTWSLAEHDCGEVLSIIDSMAAIGTDLKVFIDNYMALVLDLAKYAIFSDLSCTTIPSFLATDDNPVVQHTLDLVDKAWLMNLVDLLLSIKQDIKYDQNSKLTIEAYLLKLCK